MIIRRLQRHVEYRSVKVEVKSKEVNVIAKRDRNVLFLENSIQNSSAVKLAGLVIESLCLELYKNS